MLPFLKAQKAPTTIMAVTKPEGGIETKGEDGEIDPGLMAAAEDLIHAIQSKDAKSVAMALQAAHEMCEGGMSEPSGEEMV